MTTREDILLALQEVRHPGRQDKTIVELGMVHAIDIGEEGVKVTLAFPKRRDPLAEYLIGSTRASLIRHLPSDVRSEVATVVVDEVMPVIINTTEEALRQVPDAWREASLALGATRSQTIARVVLPAAVPGMLTGAILGLARAAGETAAIMFTAAVFYTPKMPDSVFSAVMSLPYHMYVLATAGTEIEKTRPLQYGTALILLVLVLGMNLIAIIIRDRMQRKR